MNLSVPDPVQAAAFFSARNSFTTSPAEVKKALATPQNLVVVDVRAKVDYDTSHVPGAIHLPREQWNTAAGLDKTKVNVVYCYSHECQLAGAACAELAGKGYPVVEMDGGFDIWLSSDLEVEASALI